jgi:hypothetical protein
VQLIFRQSPVNGISEILNFKISRECMPSPPSSRTFGNRHEIWASQNLGGAQNFGRLVEPMVHTKNDQLPCPVHEKVTFHTGLYFILPVPNLLAMCELAIFYTIVYTSEV